MVAVLSTVGAAALWTCAQAANPPIPPKRPARQRPELTPIPDMLPRLAVRQAGRLSPVFRGYFAIALCRVFIAIDNDFDELIGLALR